MPDLYASSTSFLNSNEYEANFCPFEAVKNTPPFGSVLYHFL